VSGRKIDRIRAALVVCSWLGMCQRGRCPTRRRSAVDAQLHDLFDESWQAAMRRYPEWATFVGDNRYGDQLFDASRDAEAADYARARRELERAQAIARERLAPADQVSLDIFVYEHEQQLRMERFVGFRRMSLGSQGGFQSGLAERLARQSGSDPRAMPSRSWRGWRRIRDGVDQEIAFLREGMALGWVPPRTVLERVVAQLDEQLGAAPDQSPFFEPFTRLGSEIGVAEQATLRAEAIRRIGADVVPAVRRLRAFVADEYLPRSPASGALDGYPDGAAVYAERVARVHHHRPDPGPGPRDRRPRARAAARRDGSGRPGGQVRRRFRCLRAPSGKRREVLPPRPGGSSRRLPRDRQADRSGTAEALRRAATRTVRRPRDAGRSGSDTAEFYSPPALDGSRAGWFNANGKAWDKRPIWAMETLVAHEAVPGHHLQIARAIELGSLPMFRRANGYNAYGEGWALYAETLGFDLGLYRDPTSRFGHLQWQAFRAARLVVDTGSIRSAGAGSARSTTWSSAPAEDERFVTSEVDRYLSWPAQALGYMIGKLKIVELRDRAKGRLGDRFDIRKFHMAVLDQGSVPLPVLERAVDDWIARTAGSPP
jgi:uncharacterized protein (DUF885 family)